MRPSPFHIFQPLSRFVRHFFLPLTIFFIGLVLTASLFIKIFTYSIDNIYRQFNLDVALHSELIKDHFSIISIQLNSLRKFFEKSTEVTPEDFKKFCESFSEQDEIVSAVLFFKQPSVSGIDLQFSSSAGEKFNNQLAHLLEQEINASFNNDSSGSANTRFLVLDLPENKFVKLIYTPLGLSGNNIRRYVGFLVDTLYIFHDPSENIWRMDIRMDILSSRNKDVIFSNWVVPTKKLMNSSFAKRFSGYAPVSREEIIFGNRSLILQMQAAPEYVLKYLYGIIWLIWPLGLLISFLAAAFVYQSSAKQEKVKLLADQNNIQLKTVETQWETILLSTNDGIIITDQSGIIFRINRAASDLSGLKDVDFLQKNIGDIFYTEENERQDARPVSRLNLSLIAEHHPTVNWVLRTKDSGKIFVKVTIAAVKTRDQQIDGMIFIIKYSSKDRATLKALATSESRFRSFYLNMNEGVALHKLVYDRDGVAVNYALLDVNPRFEEILSLRWHDISGRLATDIYTTNAAPYLETYVNVVKTGKPCVFTSYFEPLGKHFHISVVSFGEDCFATVFMDITESKKIEQQLQDNRKRLEQILKAAPSGIGIIENRVIIEANDKFCEITGYSSDEVIGKNSLMLYSSQNDYERVGNDLYSSVIKHGSTTLEVRWVRKDGLGIDVLLSLTRVNPSDNQPRYIFSALDITDRKIAEQDIIRSKNMYLNVLDSSPALIWRSDISSKNDWFNKSWLEFRGRTLEQEVGDGWIEGVHADDQSDCIKVHSNGLSLKEHFEIEYRLKRFDGQYRWIVDFGRPFILPDGTFAGYIGFCFDITDRKEAEAALEKDIAVRKETEKVLANERNLLRTLINNLPDSIYVKDPDGKKILTNRADLDFIGAKDEKSVLGKTDKELFPEDLASQFTNDDMSVLTQGRSIINKEEIIEDSMGIKRCLLTSKIPLRDDSGHIFGLVGIGRDISERKLLENKLLNMAHYDTLTSLPNRTLFFERVTTALSQARRTQTRCALLFIDLDHFKSVNDTLGHTVGDALIRDAAARLMECVRESDTLARLGGDEFIVFLNGLESGQQAQVITDRIREKFNAPRNVAGNDLFITASVGIAIFPDDGNDLEELLKNADTAMYAAKDFGRNLYCFFNSQMNQTAVTKMQIERGLRDAFGKNEFVLFYQPVIDLKNKTIRGFEALLRWFKVEGGLIMPNEFIPIAEETGLIIPIGEWVLQEACNFNMKMMHTYNQKFIISVNISVTQLRRNNMIDTIKNALLTSGLPPDCLELEITESILIDSFGTAMTVISEARHLGVRVSLDDFGTGYSSLSHIQKLPLDVLKIDRSFVQQLMAEREATDLIPIIIELAHKLHLEVIAEGIETNAQLDRLILNSCDYGQGFLISKAVRLDDLHAFLKTYNPLKNIGK